MTTDDDDDDDDDDVRIAFSLSIYLSLICLGEPLLERVVVYICGGETGSSRVYIYMRIVVVIVVVVVVVQRSP